MENDWKIQEQIAILKCDARDCTDRIHNPQIFHEWWGVTGCADEIRDQKKKRQEIEKRIVGLRDQITRRGEIGRAI